MVEGSRIIGGRRGIAPCALLDENILEIFEKENNERKVLCLSVLLFVHSIVTTINPLISFTTVLGD